MKKILVLWCCFTFISYSASSAIFSVNNEAQLEDAIDDVVPGDSIIITDGLLMDADILIDANGTSVAPITIVAQNPGLTIFSGHTRFRISGDYVVVSGLVFENCTSVSSNLIDFRRTSGDEANYSRLTDCVIRDCNPASSTEDYKWVGIRGSHNEVDHCFFENKNHVGAMLVVWSSTSPGYHNIHHNYFGPSPEGNGNGWETIRIGTSSFAQNDGFNTVEHNYFYQRDGEIEIISGKSSNCTYRYNIFVECKGGLTLRHGTNCLVEGNMFFGNNKSGTYGIRVVDRDHTVINNYMEGLNHGSSSYRHPMTLMGGDLNPEASGYQHNINNVLSYNTIVNCTRGIMIDPDSDHPVPPDNCTLSNNVVVITNNPPVAHNSNPTNTTYIGNYFYRSDGSVSVPASGYVDIDPELVVASGDSVYRPISSSPIIEDAVTGWSPEVEDFEGHMRSSNPTVGCDEISGSPPIDRGVYGPLWMAEDQDESGLNGFSILLEAEDAILGANWSIESDSLACGFQYMNPPDGNSTGTPPSSEDDYIRFEVTLTSTDFYNIYARTSTSGTSDDSFWIRVNGGAWVAWNTINGPNYPTGYHWELATGNGYTLNQGSNSIDFGRREDDIKFDKIFITTEDLSVLNLVQNNSINEEFSIRYTIENACPLDTIYFADSTNAILFPFDENTLDIDIPLTIIGNNELNTIFDGEGQYQFFTNNSSGLTLSNLSLRNGFSTINGGALINNGTLILDDLVFENNKEGTSLKSLTNNGIIIISNESSVIIKE